jgi:hypothetical protein
MRTSTSGSSKTASGLHRKASPAASARGLGRPAALLLLAALLRPTATLRAADLKPSTLAAYEQYVQAAEAQIARRRAAGRPLYIENLPSTERDRALAEIKRGEIHAAPLDVRDANGKALDIPDGMVHHWVGTAFIPRARLDDTMDVMFSYERYRETFKPEIVESRLLSRGDGDLKVYMRLQKKTSWVSATYDCDFDVHYRRADEGHAYSETRAIRIQQVENAGRPDEHKNPVGHDSGYLWGINTFWSVEQETDGVIIEWESITLSREIPFPLRWVARPYIAHLARETVTDMLTNSRAAVARSLKTPAVTPQKPAP